MIGLAREFVRNNFLNIAGRLRSEKVPSAHILAGHYIAIENMVASEKTRVLTRFYDSLSKLGELTDFSNVVERIENKDLPSDRSLIGLCFDDGFSECEEIANFFEKKNIKVGFFINSGSIEAEPEYYKEHFKRLAIGNKTFLTWNALRDMHSAGHTIGAHTVDHVRLDIAGLELLREQICRDKKQIDENIGGDCQHFAWPYGTEKDVTANAVEVAANTFKHVFSSCDYKFYKSKNEQVFNRRHVEPFWQPNHLKCFLNTPRRYY